MIKLEILYPEYMNLYGDRGNILLLKKIIPNLKIIETNLNDVPYFLKNKINILYLGPCTESQQEEIINKLLKYKKNILELINNNTIILATGNSIELFGKYIEDVNGKQIKCLNIFNICTKRFDKIRYNENVIIDVLKFKIVGFKNQLSHSYGEDKNKILNKKNNKIEMILHKNFIGTYLLGPLLILNPLFTEYILKTNNIKYNLEILLELKLAYEKRVKEFEK